MIRVRLDTVGVLSLLPALLSAQPRELSLASANARSPHVFERVAAIRELSNGQVLIADKGANQLFAYTFGSGPPRILARHGGGPGEYRTAGWLYPLGGDSTLFTDEYTSRWLILEGTAVKATVSEHESQTRSLGAQLSGTDRTGRILSVRGSHFAEGVPRLRSTADSLNVIFGSLSRDAGDPLVRVRGRGSAGWEVSRGSPGVPGRIINANPLASEDQVLLFPDGWIAVARVNAFRVDWRSSEGAWIRGQPLDREQIPVTDRMKCRAIQEFLAGSVPCPPVSLRGWPATLPAFLPTSRSQPLPRLLAAPDGQLVIARARIGMDSEGHYDLINRRGELTGSLRVPPHAAIAGFGRGAVYLVVTDEDDLQAIHRLPWP